MSRISVLVENNPVLKPIWNRIDDELQKTIIVAAIIAQQDGGKNYISTTTFMKALYILRPGKITDFFQRLPKGSIISEEEQEELEKDDGGKEEEQEEEEEEEDGFVVIPSTLLTTNDSSSSCTTTALQNLQSFSPCINSAFNHLILQQQQQQQQDNEGLLLLSSEDMFVDIAKYARGKSTQRLRHYGIQQLDIETIVQDLEWQLIERRI